MAAPLRMSFLPKVSVISRAYTRTSLLKKPNSVSRFVLKRGVQNGGKTESVPKVPLPPWKKFAMTCGGTVVVAIASVTTVVSFGLITSPFIDTWRRGFRVTAAVTSVDKPDHKISREIKRSTDHTGLKLTLYQYQTCPFCCKVRAFLDYHGLSYNVVEVNSVTRKQLKWTKYRKVPILVVDGVGEDGFMQLNDSSAIISILETYLFHRNNGSQKSMDQIQRCYPVIESQEKKKTVYDFPNKYFIMYFDEQVHKNKSTYKEERRWRAWTDNTFVHSLSPNIYRTPAEAYRAFQYFSKVGNWDQEFSALEKALVVYVGSVAMYFIGKRLKKRHNLDQDVRLSLYREANVWMKAIGPERRFMGGDTPNLADLSVYGTLVAIEGCEAFEDLMTNSKIKPWYADMKDAVSSHRGYRHAAKKS